MKLVDPSEDALNNAFAEYVAGYTDICWEEGEDVDIDAREIYPWQGWRGTLDGKRQHVRRFIQSADAVLPWLEKCWDVATSSGKDGWAIVIHMKDKATDPIWGEAKAFPRAAVIALLRAHGVQVEFTS